MPLKLLHQLSANENYKLHIKRNKKASTWTLFCLEGLEVEFS